jgi:hypothetical protein
MNIQFFPSREFLLNYVAKLSHVSYRNLRKKMRTFSYSNFGFITADKEYVKYKKIKYLLFW